MKRTPQIFIFERFVDKVVAGVKKQATIFGRSMVAPAPGKPFELVRHVDKHRIVFARGVCTRREGAVFALDDAGGASLELAGQRIAPGDDRLAAFAEAEGFRSWRALQRFHMQGGRLRFTAYVVHWDVIELALREAA